MNAKTLKRTVSKLEHLRQEFKSLIKTLPEATPGVQMLGSNCAVVSSKTIAKNHGILSPSYYINSENKKMLMDMIDRSSIESLGNKIEHILRTETIPQHDGRRTRVSPAFIKALRRIWEG